MSVTEICTMLQTGAITVAEASKLLADKKPAGAIYVKTGKRGGVSLYGLQRNPVTLYKGQWERLLAFVGAKEGNPIAAHIAADAAQEYDVEKDFKQDADLLTEITAGKHPHATRKGSKVLCKLSNKTE